MASIVILGAGLSGLSCAYHLEKNKFLDYKIFEKEKNAGGLCRSVYHEGFTFDYTGHLIHINDPYFKEFIDEILGFENLNLINRKSYIYSHKTFTHYPFQTNLFGLPPKVITECIKGFLTRSKKVRNPKNFYQWVMKHFGSGIGKYFLFPYNQKLWQFNLKKMDHSWTGRFVPKTDLEKMIEGAISHPDTKFGYNSSFYYPKNEGIQYFPNQISKKLVNKVETGFNAKFIDLNQKIIIFENGHEERFDQLISTLPLDQLLNITKFPKTLNLKPAKENLKCNSLINFNLGINIPNFSDKHWIYVPEKEFSFYRLGFWNNFSPNMTRPDCSALYGEFTYMKNKTSKSKINYLVEKSINQTLELLELNHSNIVSEKILHIQNAYVVYDEWREKNLEKLLNRLTEHSIMSIGRFGAWKYSSMQEAILDGKIAATNTLKNIIKISSATKTIFIQNQDASINQKHIEPNKYEQTDKY